MKFKIPLAMKINLKNGYRGNKWHWLWIAPLALLGGLVALDVLLAVAEWLLSIIIIGTRNWLDPK